MIPNPPECYFCPRPPTSLESFQKYYTILGLPAGASEADVRNAFRKLAMHWHPDKNHSPEAREKFIEIHEAYDALINYLRAGKPAQKKRTAQPDAAPQETAAERAKRYAEQRYSDYLKTDQYQRDLTHANFNHLFGFLLSLLFITAVPWKVYQNWGANILPAMGIIMALAAILWWPGLKSVRYIDWSRLKGGFWDYYRESLLAQAVGMVFSTTWMISYSMDVLVRPLYLFIVLSGFIVSTLVFFYLKKMTVASRTMSSIGISAFALAFLLTLNSLLYFSSRKEEYTFGYALRKTKKAAYGSSRSYSVTEEYPTLQLPDQKYSEYPGMRFFLNPSLAEKPVVTYEIARGMLGMEFVKSRYIPENEDNKEYY